MSSSHPLTVGDADDEDLDDICPVCDGECTCRPKPRPAYPVPTNHASGSAITRAPPAPAHSPPSTMQSLKIKFTAGMLSKARAAQKIKSDDAENPSPFSAQPFFAQPAASGSGSSLASKKKGRPLKGPRVKAGVDSDLDEHTRPGPYRIFKRKETTSRTKAKPKPKATKPLKGKGTTGKKGKSAATHGATHKKKAVTSDDDFGGSDLTDLDDMEDDDGQSTRFPTFMSASALSTSTFSSDDSDSSTSDLDTDSSMEAEEENYILTEERRNEKARVRRELLGEEGAKRKDPHNNWVIRPRKQSVGLSDADMDVDSDATEDEEEEEEEEEGVDEDETDENALGTYAGVATGWSGEEDDDEDSDLDAELFFANLSDSSDDSESSGEGNAADAHQTNADTDMTDSFYAARLQMENLPFEVSQGWDGQIVFSNGLREGQGVLDLDFEVSAALLVEDSASPTQDETDIEMQTSEGEDDGEYEEIGDEEASDGGDTTDDDYVDADGLPTKRMLELFRWPSSLSAIDPMSTVSPTVSPSPLNRRHRRSFDSGSVDTQGSPRPADILAGKIFWDDTDRHDRDRTPDASVISSPRGTPMMGKFEATDSPRRAILTGANKDVPSPFPRTRHRRRGSSLSSSIDHRGRSLTRPHALSISTPSLAMQSLAMQAMSTTDEHSSSEHPLATPIELHDVLDVAFLDSDVTEPTMYSGPSASESEAHPRWDHVPMGTFRRTRESGAIISDSGSATWHAETPRVAPADAFVQGSSARLLKSSPFSEITWHGRPKGASARRASNASARHVNISPVILPVRDGDRTPTLANGPPHLSPPQQESFPRKTRKELRRETKMKRKGYGPVHHQHQSQKHFHHSHHPNLKSRSTNAVQRTNFFNSPTSSVPPFNL
ncbi:hypothetical protein HWV62_13886 [Athelia sp. TMB]|nr:hypothetical protein HWV62_13886 [Athelia sp. TMB]